MQLDKISYAFKVSDKKVPFDSLPELSYKTQNVVKERGFLPPEPSKELKRSIRVFPSDLSKELNIIFAAYGLAWFVGATVLIAGTNSILPGVIFGGSALFVGGIGLLGIVLHEASEVVQKSRAEKLKRAIEQYLDSLFQYYSKKGIKLEAVLDEEIKKLKSKEIPTSEDPRIIGQKIANLQNLRKLVIARKEVQEMRNQLAIEPEKTTKYPTLGKGFHYGKPTR